MLLVYEGQVVGGDISSTALNGFMAGFDGSGGSAEQAAASPAESGAAEAPAGSFLRDSRRRLAGGLSRPRGPFFGDGSRFW